MIKKIKFLLDNFNYSVIIHHALARVLELVDRHV